MGSTSLTFTNISDSRSKSYSQKWIECNDSNVGKIIGADGNRYACTNEAGTYNWILSVQSADTNILIFLSVVVVIVIIILFLKKRKLKARKKMKRRRKD